MTKEFLEQEHDDGDPPRVHLAQVQTGMYKGPQLKEKHLRLPTDSSDMDVKEHGPQTGPKPKQFKKTKGSELRRQNADRYK